MVLALGILDARVALRRGEVARVPALLASRDPQLVLLALEWVRREGGEDMLPDVLRALRHEHPDVVVAAMETVASIGGPEHVGAILHRAPLLQVASAFRLYETLGRLGGPEAEAFLGFARRNEEDPALRSAADRALQSARARPAAPDGRRAPQSRPRSPGATGDDHEHLFAATRVHQPDGGPRRGRGFSRVHVGL